MAGPLDFWKLVREINPKHVEEEAERPFAIAAIGTPEELVTLRRLAGMDSDEVRARTGSRWREAAVPLGPEAERWLSQCTMAISLSAVSSPVPTWLLDPTNPEAVRLDTQEILTSYPELTIALPRFVPVFRREAAGKSISATARANAKVALVSALPGVFPWTAVMLPVTAIPDMWLLTKNQLMMCLRLAAIYGLDVEPVARIKELGGIVGAAFGWRAIARQFVGAVPGGVGVVSKGTIAYAATVATGRAAQAFYETGRRPTAFERRNWYESAREQGRQAAQDILARLRRRDDPETGPAAA